MNRIGAITTQGSLSMPRAILDVHADLLQFRMHVALPPNKSARIIAAVLRTIAVRPWNGALSCEPCPCHDRTCNVKRGKRVRIRRRKGLEPIPDPAATYPTTKLTGSPLEWRCGAFFAGRIA